MTAASALSILSALLTIVKWWVTYIERQKWIESGHRDAVLEGLQRTNDAIAKAKAAADAVRAAAARDPASVLRDDDGFKRPDE